MFGSWNRLFIPLAAAEPILADEVLGSSRREYDF
jgi:hypothetical protein